MKILLWFSVLLLLWYYYCKLLKYTAQAIFVIFCVHSLFLLVPERGSSMREGGAAKRGASRWRKHERMMCIGKGLVCVHVLNSDYLRNLEETSSARDSTNNYRDR